LVADIRAANGASISRAHLIRALIDALAQSDPISRAAVRSETWRRFSQHASVAVRRCRCIAGACWRGRFSRLRAGLDHFCVTLLTLELR
jgi:hypothetical protein